jgi:hypothetical protein
MDIMSGRRPSVNSAQPTPQILGRSWSAGGLDFVLAQDDPSVDRRYVLRVYRDHHVVLWRMFDDRQQAEAYAVSLSSPKPPSNDETPLPGFSGRGA